MTDNPILAAVRKVADAHRITLTEEQWERFGATLETAVIDFIRREVLALVQSDSPSDEYLDALQRQVDAEKPADFKLTPIGKPGW